MSISYNNKCAKNPENFGINFQMKIDVLKSINISVEALQEIDPDYKQNTVEQQFKDNEARIVEIAKAKIEKALQGICITTDDLK